MSELDAQGNERLTLLYQEAFGGDRILVLYDILNYLGFNSLHLRGEDDLLRMNIAKYILGQLGVWREKGDISVEFLQKLIRQ